MNIITSVMSNKAIDQYLLKKKQRWQEIYRELGSKLKYSKRGTVGEQLRYGPTTPEAQILVPAEWGASEVVKARSGRFVITDGAGRLEIADSGDSELIGWAEHREETVSSTEGGTKTQLNINRNTLYKIPLGGAVTLTRAMFYDTCDLLVASNIQGADLTSSEDVIIIIDGDVANQKWVIVQINPVKLGATAVA